MPTDGFLDRVHQENIKAAGLVGLCSREQSGAFEGLSAWQVAGDRGTEYLVCILESF